MPNLTIIGNLIFDSILKVENIKFNKSNKIIHSSYRLGGVANYKRALDKLDVSSNCIGYCGDDDYASFILKESNLINTTCFQVKNSKSAVARILVDEQNSERTSFVDWGLYNKYIAKFDDFGSVKKHLHIAYIDTFKIDATLLKTLKSHGIKISADFCGAYIFDDLYQYLETVIPILEVAFISEEDYLDLPERIKTLLLNITLIRHCPKKTILRTMNKDIVVQNKQYVSESNINVLGAGDIYASHILKGFLEDKMDLYTLTEHAQRETLKDLINESS